MHVRHFSVNKASIEELIALIEYLYQQNLDILNKHGVISISPNESLNGQIDQIVLFLFHSFPIARVLIRLQLVLSQRNKTGK